MLANFVVLLRILPPKDAKELFHRMDARPGSIVTSDDKLKLSKYHQDWTKRYQGNTSIVVRPNSTTEISKILEYCNSRRIGVVPQAGNTGLVGGSVGIDHEIILSVECLNNIEGFSDSHSGILRAGAGCILQDLQDYATNHNYLVPVDLGAKGTCQIGGNVSTNAGGSYYYRYGSLHSNVMGLEVVLADGKILNLGYRPSHLKDNTGYDLKHLFVGGEGTLGVISNVSLMCPALPQSKAAAFLACSDFQSVCRTMSAAKSVLGEVLAAFEFMDGRVLEIVQNSQTQINIPFNEIYPYSILVETHGSNQRHDEEKMEAFVQNVLEEDLVVDGVLAQNLAQVESFWKLREACNPSVASQGYVYKYDVSLPVDQFCVFAEEVQNGLLLYMKQVGKFADSFPVPVVTNWGHVIDGNLHMNVVVPGIFERDDQLYHCIEALVLDGITSRGGSISAEHGLGQYKNRHMDRIKGVSTLQTMRGIKTLFDPNGIMNPGKFLPPSLKPTSELS